MYGAILGDIFGSRFEFDNGGLTKDFELLTYESKWTDDKTIILDRPFIYAIVHNETKLPVFVGMMNHA